MLDIIYSVQAEKDLVDIGCYLSERNSQSAANLVGKIFSSCADLCNFPFIGQARDDIASGVRHLIVGNYLILYKVEEKSVYINRIVHAARYLPDLL